MNIRREVKAAGPAPSIGGWGRLRAPGMGTVQDRRAAAFAAAVFLYFACCGPCRAQAAGPGAPPSGKLHLDLDDESLLGRLQFTLQGASTFGLLFDADERGFRLVGALEAESSDRAASRIVAGPGSACGALRLSANPASLSSGLDGVGCVELDSALASGTAVLGLDAGPFSAFALERGAGAGVALRRSGSPVSEPDTGSKPEAAAAGFGLVLPCAEGLVRGTASVSLRSGRAGGDGWRPDPPPDPAGSVLNCALLRELRWPSGWAVAGLAASYGRLEGRSLAARLEAVERRGGLSLRLAGGAAGANYRDLYGSRPLHDLGLAGDLRAVIEGAARVDASVRLESKPVEAPPAGPMPAGAWSPVLADRSYGIALTAPLSRPGQSADLSLDFERSPGAAPLLTFGLGLSIAERSDAVLWRCRWSGELRQGGSGGSGIDGLSFALSASRGMLSGRRGPLMDLDLGLDLLEAGSFGAPVVADLGFDFWLPLASAARVGLGVDLPQARLGLETPGCPRNEGAKLSLSYRSEFGR